MADQHDQSIHVADYIVLAVVILASAVIGVYAACSGGRQRTTAEYLLGNRKMNYVTVGMSIMISSLSATRLLGVPAEIYSFGSTYWWSLVGHAVGAVFAAYTVMPVFYRLKITSIYTYLELRYNSILRKLATVVFMLQSIFFNAIVLYSPALALNAVTGINLEVSILATGLVCIFYTTIGGIKAVLWTDAFQTVVLVVGVVGIFVMTTIDVGGLKEGWKVAEEGGRIIWFETSLDYTLRNTVWGVFSAFVISAAGKYMNQITVQRCLTCSSVQKARYSIFVGMVTHILCQSLLCLCGVMMYAYFSDCDPLRNKEIRKVDQLFPYLVVDVFSSLPGMTGLFLASVVSATMSTVSSSWNAMAAVLGEGTIKTIWPNIKETTYIKVTKVISFMFGVLALGLAYVIPLLGQGLVLLVAAINSISSGIVAAFLLGIFSHHCNWKGSFAGIVVSAALIVWLRIGGSLHPNTAHSLLPVSTEGCAVQNTTGYTTLGAATSVSMATYTTNAPAVETRFPLQDLYDMSFNLYPLVALTVSTVVNIVVSGATGFNSRSSVEKRLLYSRGGKTFDDTPTHQQNTHGAEEIKTENGKVNDGLELDVIEATKS